MVRLRLPGVSAVFVNGGADSGALKRGGFLSAGDAGRTGSSRTLLPVASVSVTGSGEGQMSGQYVVEAATRMRWRLANAYAVSISGKRAVYCWPGVSRVTLSGPSICVRLKVA